MLVGVLAVVAFLAGSAPAMGATASQLRRYPYLTDASASAATLNWATDTSATTAAATWGPAGTACDAHQASATRTSITVDGIGESQWRATLDGLTPDTAYCYRVSLGATDLLGTDPAGQFTTLPAALSGSYRFAVFGDTGRVDATGANPDQANLMGRIGASGARFSLFTGDIPYVQAGQTTETAYGDLLSPLSGVFGPSFWTVPGRSIPMFAALGNHGLSSSFLNNWPQTRAAAASGGRYQMDTYSGADATTAASYPSGWYAFDAGNARVYVLDAAWANSNIGTAADIYQADFDYHWNPAKAGCTPACGEQYRWLQQDLASHPSTLKFAVFHFPLYSDNASETSDDFLKATGPAGPSSLESLLSRNGVDIVFNGHAHLYERNTKQNGMVSYVTGGGGAETEPVNTCSAFDAYAIGWSSRGGTSCKAPTPTSVAQVTHFLLVDVNGTSVTVTPTDSTGRTFDAQAYDFGGPPSVTGAPSPPRTPGPGAPSTAIGGAPGAGARACATRFTGTARADRLVGTERGDRILGLAGKDVLDGRGGADCLLGGPGSDRLVGRAGADRLSGAGGDDRLSGGAGNDTLRAGEGRDRLLGGSGRDHLEGGRSGRDRLDAGSGDDTIDARNRSRDVVICGPGRDRARVDRADRVRGCERVTREGRR